MTNPTIRECINKALTDFDKLDDHDKYNAANNGWLDKVLTSIAERAVDNERERVREELEKGLVSWERDHEVLLRDGDNPAFERGAITVIKSMLNATPPDTVSGDK